MVSSSRRPRLVTVERIVDAGIALTLPEVTVKAVAEKLGVSQVAIYNHVGSADGLRRIVAEGIIDRQEIPVPVGDDVAADLLRLAFALRAFVHRYPGVGAYLAQIDASSRVAVARIDLAMAGYATRYALSARYAAWLVSTVAEHAIALAELIHVPGGRRRGDPEAIRERDDLVVLPHGLATSEAPTPDDYFAWSMRAVILGAITLLDAEHDAIDGATASRGG